MVEHIHPIPLSEIIGRALQILAHGVALAVVYPAYIKHSLDNHRDVLMSLRNSLMKQRM